MHRRRNRQRFHHVPCKLTADTRPVAERTNVNKQALPTPVAHPSCSLTGSTLIHHAPEVICLRLISSLSNSLPDFRLTEIAHLRILVLEVSAVLGMLAFSLGVSGFIGSGQKGRQRIGKEILVPKTLGAEELSLLAGGRFEGWVRCVGLIHERIGLCGWWIGDISIL